MCCEYLTLAIIQAPPSTSPDFFKDLPLWQKTLVPSQHEKTLDNEVGSTHWKDNNYLGSILNDDCKVEPYFKTFESFVDDNVLDLRRWNEGRSG